MTNKDERHERLARARALRATALLMLKRHGFTENDRTLKMARVGSIKIEYRNTSPTLQIWERGRNVFLFEWNEKGRENLVIYDAGDWERALDERMP
jgi:hypothetical protein